MMRLSLKKANNILGTIGVIGGIIIIALAYVQNLAFIKKGLPGPGFFPILCGIAIIFCSLLLFTENYFKVKKNPDDSELKSNIINMTEIRNFSFIIGASVFVMIVTQFIGLLLSIGLSVIGLVKWMAKESWIKSILVGIGTTIVLYLIFQSFLGVSLPKSLIGF